MLPKVISKRQCLVSVEERLEVKNAWIAIVVAEDDFIFAQGAAPPALLQ
jgi:hypothetical protein